MKNIEHLSTIYSSELLKYGSQDSITRAPFTPGETVILCKKTNNLIALRSLQENNYECPHCRTRLNPDLTSSGPVKLPPAKKDTLTPVPYRPAFNTTLLWGGLTAFMLLCFIASALGVFGSLTATTTATNEGITALPTYTQISPTFTYVPSQPPLTAPTVRPTAKPISPTPIQSTGSSVSCSGITVSSNKSSKGTILHITPCSGSEYDLGPLANGAYIVDPNDKFLVYVSAGDGTVYIAKIGDTSFVTLGNLKRDHGFSAFYKDETPSFRLVISGSSLIIHEDKFNQEASYSIPSWAR